MIVIKYSMEPEQDPKVNIDRLFTLIERKNEIKETDQSVLLMGMTGAGKSTLINLLLGRKMRVITVNEKNMFELEEKEKGAKIGNSYNAETTFPQLFYDDVHQITYCDCPGFLDTKGVEYDIANALYIKHLFRKIKKVKILLVIGAEQLEGRAIHFVQKIQKMYHMIPAFGSIRKSIALVITKATKSQEMYAQDLKNILSAREEYFYDEDFKEYFGELVKRCSPLLFQFPKSTDQAYTQQNVKEIITHLQGLECAEGVEIEKIPISAESEKVLFRLTQQYQIYIHLKLSKWVEQIDDFCSSEPNKIVLFYKLKQGRADLKLMQIMPKNIRSEGNSQQIENAICKFMSALSLKTEVQSILDVLKFCSEINPELGPHCSELKMFKTTAVELCILEYLRKIKKGVLKEIAAKLDSYEGKFATLTDLSSIEELQAIRTNVKELLEVSGEQLFFKQAGNVFSFQISLESIQTIISEEEKQRAAAIHENQSVKTEDSLVVLVNELYKTRDPEFCLLSEVYTLVKSFYTRKSEEIHKIIIEKLKKNSASQESEVLKKRLEAIESNQEKNLKRIKNGKITFEGRRNGLFMKAHCISLAIMSKQIYDHIDDQIGFESSSPTKASKKDDRVRSTHFLTINSPERNRADEMLDRKSYRKNPFLKSEYITLGFYCFIFGGEEIYIDDDFRAYCNMLFVAPRIIIRKNRYGERPIITLKGYDGEPVSSTKPTKRIANKSDFDNCDREHYRLRGQNGLNGNSGYPGGNMTMIADQFIGLENLTVDLSGGNGSNGQEGGDGASCNHSYLTRPNKGHGGDGGTGGNGGARGKMGFLTLYDSKGNQVDHSKIRLISREGMSGRPGKGGEGGVPWDKGKKDDKKKFKFGRTGEDGICSEESLKYSNLVLRQCEFQYLRTNYSRDFLAVYKDTGYENFLEKAGKDTKW